MLNSFTWCRRRIGDFEMISCAKVWDTDWDTEQSENILHS